MRSAAFLVLVLASAQATDPPAKLKRRIVEQHAALVYFVYGTIEQSAFVLSDRIRAFLAAPSEETLRAAREAWTKARVVYGRSEVFRFYGGPIDDAKDGLESLLNAWPLDEAYVDAVRGDPGAGIINRPKQYPNLNRTILTVLNERGGEANISTGWHAIEFLLWGQDFFADGPGRRPHTDFVAGKGKNAKRRALYLRVVTDLLVRHLRKVKAAWAPGKDNYRRRFENDDPDRSLRKILVGMVVLSGFEMTGERLAVPYETRDQEEEHSCFSDTTHNDLVANQHGLAAVYARGIGDLARAMDEKLAARLDERIGAAHAALQAIPPPFDRAIQGAEGRRAVLAAIEALEAQTDALSTLAKKLGFDIALEPGG